MDKDLFDTVQLDFGRDDTIERQSASTVNFPKLVHSCTMFLALISSSVCLRAFLLVYDGGQK